MFQFLEKIQENNTNFFVERLSAIFIFTLIISGNYIGELFPCKIQRILTNNMIIKHFFGFITLFFFGVLAVPELNNVRGLMSSVILYLIFLINANTNYKIWIGVVILYAFLYLINIIKKGYIEKIETESKENAILPTLLKDKQMIKLITIFEWIAIVLIIVSTIFGFVIYVGEKKIEYGKKFNWFTFLSGKPNCRHQSPDLTYKEVITAAFSK
jgi:hypothetical protein|uniref:Uncharacterized protein n=1 Tax=viral metagenome TaxID=1070528 RepID=A0A6C0CKX3_9ZZZZ